MRTATQASDRAPPRLEDIYRDHLEFAWRTVRYLGVPAADAEDVVHEIFIIVQRRLDDYDARYSIRSWIAGISRRVVLHVHRKAARTEQKIARLEPPSDATFSPDEIISRQEASAVLQAFLNGLDVDKREAFVLGELEGLAAAEIAHAMGHNVNTVYSRLRSARQAFQKYVDRLDVIRRREGG